MSYNTYNSPIFVLVTTFNRNELLKSRSLVSISNQTIDFENTDTFCPKHRANPSVFLVCAIEIA